MGQMVTTRGQARRSLADDKEEAQSNGRSRADVDAAMKTAASGDKSDADAVAVRNRAAPTGRKRKSGAKVDGNGVTRKNANKTKDVIEKGEDDLLPTRKKRKIADADTDSTINVKKPTTRKKASSTTGKIDSFQNTEDGLNEQPASASRSSNRKKVKAKKKRCNDKSIEESTSTAATDSTEQNCPLLSMPREIRDMILEIVLTKASKFVNPEAPNFNQRHMASRKNAPVAILRTRSQLYGEGTAILHGCNAFVFFSEGKATNFLDEIVNGVERFRQVHDVTINVRTCPVEEEGSYYFRTGDRHDLSTLGRSIIESELSRYFGEEFAHNAASIPDLGATCTHAKPIMPLSLKMSRYAKKEAAHRRFEALQKLTIRLEPTIWYMQPASIGWYTTTSLCEGMFTRMMILIRQTIVLMDSAACSLPRLRSVKLLLNAPAQPETWEPEMTEIVQACERSILEAAAGTLDEATLKACADFAASFRAWEKPKLVQEYGLRLKSVKLEDYKDLFGIPLTCWMNLQPLFGRAMQDFLEKRVDSAAEDSGVVSQTN